MMITVITVLCINNVMAGDALVLQHQTSVNHNVDHMKNIIVANDTKIVTMKIWYISDATFNLFMGMK